MLCFTPSKLCTFVAIFLFAENLISFRSLCLGLSFYIKYCFSPSLTPPLWERVLPFSMAGLSHVVPHFLQCGVMAFPRFLSFSPPPLAVDYTHLPYLLRTYSSSKAILLVSYHLCDSYQEAKENPPYRESHESKFHAKSRNTKGTITLYSMSPRITVVLLPCV